MLEESDSKVEFAFSLDWLRLWEWFWSKDESKVVLPSALKFSGTVEFDSKVKFNSTVWLVVVSYY